MKKLILQLKKDRQAYAFAVLGLILILFPKQVAGAVPYILGLGLILYALLNIVISIKYPDAETRLGDGIVKGVIGAVILTLKAESIGILGVIWAVQSLDEVAEEIDECRRTKTVSVISVIGMLVSLALAVMLMTDPSEHFSFHVRILGLEMISSVFIRRRKKGAKA